MNTILQNSSLTIVSGNNFSGRSDYLKSIVDLERGIYIGEQPSSAISGIFPTVKSEINLHSGSTDKSVLSSVNALFELYRFQNNYNKNPFILSGGEQAILAILSAILLQPKKLAIDCTLEQLNEAWRAPLLSAIQQGIFSGTEILLADNRIDEYGLVCIKNVVPINNSEKHKYRFEKVSIPKYLEYASTRKTIELNNIDFYYNKNQPIFKNIKAQLLPSEIYHLQGSNGAGKSTLAKLLTGILKPQSGAILVNNVKYNAYKYPGQLVAYSFQNPDEQIFSTSIENEVLPFQKNESIAYKERREVFLEMFGLQNVKKEHPAEMPFSIRKRIALAATLSLDRAWYFLDEPTLGQDNNFADFLLGLLIKLKDMGKGIVVISHSKRFTEKLDSKKLILDNHNLSLGK